MNTTKLTAYELIKQENIEDIHAEGYLFRHKKTGARVVVLENEDENKVFNIAFRTPPTDSTGVPHILEHSVLCGSREFPLKDPFVELAKGSLNTFLNALTYPDKTMYPVASCNDQDFKNLMHVYMDAVFYPNIYKNSKTFEQEGWSYHLDSVDAPLTYNGVVYNEMKGVFSSAEELLDRTIFNTLFPDTPYGVESGGDPDVIPELTYEEFLSFHKKYYHPSNSYIYLYGNADMVERLNWLDEKYLKDYESYQVDSVIPMQQPFAKATEMVMEYPISDGESLEDNAYLSWNVVVGDALDIEQNVAFGILEYALLAAPGAPLKQVLIDAKIGKDVFGSYSDGILQPFFSVVAKNSSLEKKEEFLSLIRSTLEKIVAEGIDQKSLEAGINYNEFRFREADYTSYPKGLIYNMSMMESWLYDDDKPFEYLRMLSVYDCLKKKIGTGYFEELIQKYLLNNNHMSVVCTVPKKGLAKEKEEQLKVKLQSIKDSLSKEELEQMVENTKALQEYQDMEETEEAIASMPMLQRQDIKRETLRLYNEEKNVAGVDVLYHQLETNGIGYLTLLFDIDQIPAFYAPYLGLFKAVLGYVDTKHFSYGELFNEINANTGGINCGIQEFNPKQKGEKFRARFGIKCKTLYSKLEFAFRMMDEIIHTSKMNDEKRLYEIIAEQKSRTQMGLVSAGHSTAMLRATSYFSEMACFQDQIAGVGYYEMLTDLEAHFEERKGELIEILKDLAELIFQPDRLTVSYTACLDGYEQLEKTLPSFVGTLKTTEKTLDGAVRFTPEQKNEAFKTAGQVQYVAQAGDYHIGGYKYDGALRVLRTIMSYEYLWNNVRVKGGAYGCMSGFKRCGDTFFVSYRDPNLTRTLDVYEGIPEFVRGFTADEKTMTKYIIGTISGMDSPLNPSALGALSLSAYMNQITEADMQKERDQVLFATDADIQKLADLIQCVLDQKHICVVGSGTVIDENKELFNHISEL